jgi:hypothetical protein
MLTEIPTSAIAEIRSMRRRSATVTLPSMAGTTAAMPRATMSDAPRLLSRL